MHDLKWSKSKSAEKHSTSCRYLFKAEPVNLQQQQLVPCRIQLVTCLWNLDPNALLLFIEICGRLFLLSSPQVPPHRLGAGLGLNWITYLY